MFAFWCPGLLISIVDIYFLSVVYFVTLWQLGFPWWDCSSGIRIFPRHLLTYYANGNVLDCWLAIFFCDIWFLSLVLYLTLWQLGFP